MAPANIAPQAPRTMKARIHTTMLATAAPQNPKKPILNAVPADTTTCCFGAAKTAGTGTQVWPSHR